MRKLRRRCAGVHSHAPARGCVQRRGADQPLAELAREYPVRASDVWLQAFRRAAAERASLRWRQLLYRRCGFAGVRVGEASHRELRKADVDLVLAGVSAPKADRYARVLQAFLGYLRARGVNSFEMLASYGGHAVTCRACTFLQVKLSDRSWARSHAQIFLSALTREMHRVSAGG